MKRGTSLDISIYNYEVFLSFRGPDTRKGFVDCLYHFMTNEGIRVFKDDEDLRRGQRIEMVFEAINKSKICIPIFSEDYPSSKWCMRELTKMVELGKEIMPIFYDVTPNDVKLQTRVYHNKLGGFPERFASERVQWEKSLVEVASINGWELKNRGFGEFSKRIVAELSTKLKLREKIVPEYIIGMEDQVERMMKMLDLECDDVRFVGIYGIGGLGKKTLAKVVFNKLLSRFSCASYLEDIRETSNRDGLTCLLRQLLNDLGSSLGDISDWNSGIMRFRKILHDQKVLIVLDDVGSWEQIETLAGNSSWYGPGSRIIVITRYDCRRWKYRICQSLQMEPLYPIQALQFFSRCAFNAESPPASFINLSRQAALATGGIPLALKVVGSLLRHKSIQEWDEIILSIQTNPEIQQILMISYNSLEVRSKQIFLDIACMFVNEETTNCIYMWEACNFYPNKAITDLISMSLVKISNDNKFEMHELVRALGREIVQQKSLNDLGKGRLWKCEDSLEVLQSEEGKEKVQALRIHWNSSDTLRLGHEALRGLRNIRFLSLHGLVIKGNSEFRNLPNLRWLSWDDFSSKTIKLNLPKLVVLDISSPDITRLWSQIKMVNLKVLILRSCSSVSETFGFPELTSLERLTVQNCRSLCRFDGSIGKLKRLKYLKLQGCVNLEGLPEEIGGLGDLEIIIMEGGGSSFSLPESVGRLVKLRHLSVRICLASVEDPTHENGSAPTVGKGRMSKSREWAAMCLVVFLGLCFSYALSASTKGSKIKQ